MADQDPTLLSADAQRFRAYERRRHDSLAASYHDFFTPVTALAIPHLCEVVHLAPGLKLLDVATGPGALAAQATRLGAHAVGIDLSPGMIALAKQLYPGTDFRVADVEHLPFTDGSFDGLVCNFAIGHFPYPEAAVGECVRTLRRGGRIALSWWDNPSRQRIQGLFREAIDEIGANPPPDVPVPTGAGAADVRIDEHQTTYTVSDIDTLWSGGLGSFAVTASAITHQDKPTQDAIRAVLERRAAVYKTANGYTLPIAFKIAHGLVPAG